MTSFKQTVKEKKVLIVILGLVGLAYLGSLLPKEQEEMKLPDRFSKPSVLLTEYQAPIGKTVLWKDDKNIPVGRSKTDLDRLVQLVVAGDEIGLEQMNRDGSAWLVESETEIIVIDKGYISSEIRIKSGKYKDQLWGLVQSISMNNNTELVTNKKIPMA